MNRMLVEIYTLKAILVRSQTKMSCMLLGTGENSIFVIKWQGT